MIQIDIPEGLTADIFPEDQQEVFDTLCHCNGDLTLNEARQLIQMIAVGLRCMQRRQEREAPNPWRYPSRGEWPEDGDKVQVTFLNVGVMVGPFWDVGVGMFFAEQWQVGTQRDVRVRAWKELDEPAPELEVTE